MEEILDSLEHQMLQYLPVSEFIKLCQTSSTFAQFCNNDDTWRYFIGRDFGIVYQGKNPRKFYLEREAEDLYVRRELKKIELSLEQREEEAIWILLKLAGYKLDQKIPMLNDKNMVSIRFYAILCSFIKYIKVLQTLHENLVDQLYPLVSKHFGHLGILEKFWMASESVGRGEDFFRQVFDRPELLNILEINTFANLDSMMQSVQEGLFGTNLCKRLAELQSDDPVLRNL